MFVVNKISFCDEVDVSSTSLPEHELNTVALLADENLSNSGTCWLFLPFSVTFSLPSS